MAERISVSLALAALEDQCAVVQECDTRLTEALHVRNTLIRDALLSGVPYPRVARITGLSRNRLWKIRNNTPFDTDD